MTESVAALVVYLTEMKPQNIAHPVQYSGKNYAKDVLIDKSVLSSRQKNTVESIKALLKEGNGKRSELSAGQ